MADSYLGYGLAVEGGQYEDGLRRCRAAVRRELWEPETWLNLARTYLLRREKRSAVQAIEQGLEIDPDQAELLALQRRLGVRRRPVLGFLDRGHPLNVALGKMRHGFSRRS